jgi:hypothetical protein
MHIHECPKCGGALIRVHRRPLDRLQSVVLPVRRFRCDAFHCRYEGNLRRTVSTKRKLTLASAGLLGAMLAGALGLHSILPWTSHISISAENSDTSLVPHWADARLCQGVVAPAAQPYFGDPQCESGASVLKTEHDRVQPYASAGN